MPKAGKYGILKTGGRSSNNSFVSYYGTLRTAINCAYKEGIITVNPTKEFDFASKVRQEPSRREYLTIDELKTFLINGNPLNTAASSTPKHTTANSLSNE